MDWRDVREHYRRAFGIARRRGLTQTDVARAAGLGQNHISRILNWRDDSLGPTIMTFLKALQGIGLPASIFFAELEHRHPDPLRPTIPPPAPSPDNEAEAALERTIGRLVLYAIRLATPPRKP
jgi:transcriptional regulator with XRE-family HTH domain